MLTFVEFTAIFKQTDVKRIREDKRRFGFGDSLSGSGGDIVLRQKGSHIFQSHITFDIFLKSQAHDTRFLFLDYDCFCPAVVQIPHWRLAWEYTHSHFLAKSTLCVFGKRIYIVFALDKGHRQRKFALWSVFKPVAREFEARKVFDVEKVDNLSAVHRIARQTIGVPR